MVAGKQLTARGPMFPAFCPSCRWPMLKDTQFIRVDAQNLSQCVTK